MCHKSNRPPTELQLEHAIRRNFGGLEQKDLNPLMIFKKHLFLNGKQADFEDMTQEVCRYCYSVLNSHLYYIFTMHWIH